MTLRTRTLRLIGLSTAALIAVVYLTISVISRKDYARLEQREALKNIQRVKDAINTSLGGLSTIVRDWSAWDDTYTFIADINSAYKKASLSDPSLVGLGVNLIAYLDQRGRAVFVKAIENGHNAPVPAGLERYFKAGSPLLHGSNPAGVTTGILRLLSGSMLVASRPILTSDGFGPSRGTLVMARNLDAALLNELGQVTHLSVAEERPEDPALPEDDREAIAALKGGAPAVIHTEDAHTLAGYFLLRDVFGDPASVIRMNEPREIYQQGETGLRYVLFALLGIGAVFGALSLGLIERSVLSRLLRLSAEVTEVGQSGHPSARITVDGRDELGSLAATINTTLAVLERTQLDLQRRELELHISQERYALAVQGANDGLWDWNLSTNEMYLSPRWKAMLGYAEDELGNNAEDWMELIHPEDRERVQGELETHLQGHTPHLAGQHRLRHRDGSYRLVLHRGLAVRDGTGDAYRMAGSTTDLTERGAYYDTLTGLPSRRLLTDRLERAVARHVRNDGFDFAVLFMDVNRFKVVNDSLGHLTGDQLLVAVARRLEANMRPGDTVARLGGDEFVVLLENPTSSSEPLTVAARLGHALDAPFALEGHEVFSSLSIGIATSRNGWTADDYLRAADTAMYRAKAQGTGFEVFDTTMHTEALERMEIETGLRRALERDELRVYFQPVVSLKAGQTTIGFEALVRWQHPKRGLLTPDAFLPVAEETGLIAEIDMWVLRAACLHARAWPMVKHEPAHTVSVNLSSRLLANPDLAERIETVLTETGLAAHRLRLEITETALIKGGEHLQAAFSRLREKGITILLDDFGQGYSSLSYLHRFPIDTLKIDRAFVRDLLGSDGVRGESSEIVQTIIALAHNMDLTVIAEGIENADQLAQLRALGCEYGQGYLFARPMDAASIGAWDRQLEPAWA
jgi:diguanylate cyclase (GGDEF)-like protein/PAS domain S-box-containing protein